MKKFFIIAAAALVTLAACSKSEIDSTSMQSRVINFSAVTGKATKAPITTAYYPEDIPFGVFCYAVTSGTWDAKYNTDDAQLYMDNEQISYVEDNAVDANGIYAPSETYYWPLSGSLTFIGYSPYMASGAAYTKSTRTLTISNFTQEADTDDQVDLMWATTNADQTNNGSHHYSSSSSDVASENAGVDIVFHHALSQVKFFVRKKTADLDDYTLTVNSITFTAHNKGTFAIANDAITTATSEGVTYNTNWTGQTTTTNFVFDTEGTDVEAPDHGDEYAAFGVANMPVPQQLVSGTQKFTITYSLEKGGVNLGQKEVPNIDLLGATVKAWLPNTIYNYYIDIDLDKIYFNPAVTVWDTTEQSQQIDVQ